MAEQKHNEAEASDDVSMDEILTSLRNILEEEDPDQQADSTDDAQTAAPEQEPAPAAPAGDTGEDELVLTDVVDEGPAAPAEPDATSPGDEAAAPQGDAGETGGEGSEFDALFGRWEREEEPEGDNPAPALDDPEQAPAEETFDLGGEPESPAPEPIAEGAAVSEPTPEPSPEPAPAAEPGAVNEGPPAAESGPASAPAEVDSQALQEAVENTVQEQVAQATAELDSRLAEALEPKIREALQGYLDERLPALLREIAEAEIERIKKGE